MVSLTFHNFVGGGGSSQPQQRKTRKKAKGRERTDSFSSDSDSDSDSKASSNYEKEMEENLNHVGLFIGPEDDDLPVEGEYDIAFFSGKLKNFFAYYSVLCSWTTLRAPVCLPNYYASSF